MTVLGNVGDRLDLRIKQGAHFGPFPFSMSNQDGTPVNLTGCDIKGAIYRTKSEPKVADLDVVVTDAAGGKYEVAMTNVDTALLKAGSSPSDIQSQYLWELWMVNSAGHVTPIFYGSVTVHMSLIA